MVRHPTRSRLSVVAGLLLLASLSGCITEDPAARFIRMMDSLPPEERVPNWEQTKALIARHAPSPGEPAPDFTLSTLDGAKQIQLSAYRPGQPKFLIFGSYT
jgi:ABC-type uncharacterized transport system auxiliary subunit